MSKGAICFSTNNEYYTPKELVGYFGKFEYDPATTDEKAKDLCINNYDTIETDGLLQDWSKYKRIWINPPFTIKHKFFEKACNTYLENKDAEIYILFPIEFLTTKRFFESVKKVGGGKIYLPNGRIKFQPGLKGRTKSPAFGSVVFKIQDKWELELLNLEILKGHE